MSPITRRQALTASVGAAGGIGLAATSCAARATGPNLEARDGTRLFHLDWGAGKPVVFCHAWGLNADLWEYQMTALAERGLRCVAYDRRGHGRSPDPGYGYDFDTLADDLAAVLDQLDLHDVTLVGHSMGGGEVARYLTRHGTARIARTVLISAVTPIVGKAPDYPAGTERQATEAFIAALQQDRPATIAAGLPLFTGAHREVSPAMSQWLVSQFLRASPRAMVECQRAIHAADFRPDLRAFTIPTLIVHGDDDQVLPLDKHGAATARAIPGSALTIYPGGPHGAPITDRARFTEDLRTFITS